MARLLGNHRHVSAQSVTHEGLAEHTQKQRLRVAAHNGVRPGDRWVEVQIRTKRMDLIAEKGLAAHWKYKGIKSEGDLDTWMNNVRDILEAAETGPMELMKNMKMDIYDKGGVRVHA